MLRRLMRYTVIGTWNCQLGGYGQGGLGKEPVGSRSEAPADGVENEVP